MSFILEIIWALVPVIILIIVVVVWNEFKKDSNRPSNIRRPWDRR